MAPGGILPDGASSMPLKRTRVRCWKSWSTPPAAFHGARVLSRSRFRVGISIEEVTPDDLPHWDSPSFEPAQDLGNRWYDERRTPVLIVPSVVTLVERIVLINQEHRDFRRIRASQPMPVRWDERLWRRR